jgi:hypothetical protein
MPNNFDVSMVVINDYEFIVAVISMYIMYGSSMYIVSPLTTKKKWLVEKVVGF